jgi:hypothetical protein
MTINAHQSPLAGKGAAMTKFHHLDQTKDLAPGEPPN